MIDNKTEILNGADIVAVVREYASNIELEKAGTNWKAPCPFHSEKTASFTISPSKNIFKCFGCQRGGDAADFLQAHLGITFPEALEKIAAVSKMKVHYREGVEPSKYKAEKKAEREQIESLSAYFNKALEHYAANPEALEETEREGKIYVNVAGREYLKTTAAAFGLMPPAPARYLAEFAAAQKWDIEKLKLLGIVNQSESGSLYDTFRGRFLFTIRDQAGRPVALAGRLPAGSTDNAPKYINSKQSLLYNKSEVLFGFDLARKAIHNTETVYLVEGYTDVMTCYEFGLENVAATCGTALTDDHCRLLRRFGVRNVVLFRDGDKAGQNAAKKDVFTLLKNGLRPKVLICHEGHDPDSQVRELGEKGFRGFRETEQDGIIWRAMIEFDKKDPAKQTAALMVAAELISYISLPGERDIYKKALSTGETMGNVQKALEKEIARFETLRAPKKKKNGLDTEENIDGMTYGIFKKDNAYFRFDLEGAHTQVTNFVINPQYLIKDKDLPRRIVEIKNIYGHTAILNVDTSIFGTMQKFRDEIAKHGNFIFEPAAKSLDFNMIVKKTYDEMNDATGYQVIAMGWHQRGFYTWANGITDLHGNFYEPDEYGLVNFDGVKFLLPGYGITQNDENFDMSEEDNAHIKAFRYFPGKAISFGDWNQQFMKVYGENGMMGTAFYLSTLFRDIIFPKNKSFPLLNGFGKKGKGKSTMMWSLAYMFGDARLAGVLGVSTYTAFYRSFMQISNGIVWFDEYHNKLDLKTWIKPMMGIWDGNGRALGNITSTTGTSTTPIRAAFAYTGQDMPVVNDGALLSRSIVLTFDYERTPEAETNLRELRDIEQTGQLSAITVQVLKHREKVERLFDITYSEVKNDLTDYMRAKMVDMEKMESRTLQNHTIPLTVFKILEPEFEFAFSYLDLVAFTADLIEKQANVIQSSDDTGQFWQVLEYLANTGKMRHDREILVEMTGKVTREKSRNESETEIFKDKEGNPAERKVIFLRHKDAFMVYAEQMRSIAKDALDLATIEHYLQTSNAFLGVSRGKKFNNGRDVRRCLMFDATQLEGVEFLLTVEAKSQLPTGDDDATYEDENDKKDMPF